jgi:hypothetical protein
VIELQYRFTTFTMVLNGLLVYLVYQFTRFTVFTGSNL